MFILSVWLLSMNVAEYTQHGHRLITFLSSPYLCSISPRLVDARAPRFYFKEHWKLQVCKDLGDA